MSSILRNHRCALLTFSSGNDDFGSSVLTIVVDKSEHEYHIHGAKLAKLSRFFDVEAEYGNKDEIHDVAAKRARTEADSTVKVEDDESSTEVGDTQEKGETGGKDGNDEKDKKDIEDKDEKKMAHYCLPHIKADAFTTFTSYLYNKNPRRPRNMADCKMLIRSYILAIKYKVLPLQNMIVDRMRQFHTGVDFNIDILAYLMNRQPGKNRLMEYFIAQMAFDVALKGYDEFTSSNEFFHYFISDHSRPLRLNFVKELAGHANSVRRLEDPSGLSGCKWHDHRDGSTCEEDNDD